MDDKDIISQLWVCLKRQYTYDEAKIHIEAFMQGMTTQREVVVVKKKDE